MSDLALDPSRSRVQIHTFAEGLLARLAHDLAFVCLELDGVVAVDAAGASGTATIAMPLRGIKLAGILGKDGRIDEDGLSATDRQDCTTKMHKDVFHAGPDALVQVEAHLDGGSARVRILPPHGKPIIQTVHPDLRSEEDGVRATGTFAVSLAGIGSDAIKGPMGAFRVKDRVMVLFDVVFVKR